MKTVRQFLRSLIMPVYSPYRRLRRSKAKDSFLLSLNVGLTRTHLKNTRLLPDRKSLLEELPTGGVVAEVGVADGRFSQHILDICEPDILHLIDAWGMSDHAEYGDPAFHKVCNKFADSIEQGGVRVLRGLSWEMLDTLADRSLDWVYIDAAHDYTSVKKDLAAAQRKVKQQGLIVGHDYVRWGRFGQRFGVLEAVNEFCLDNAFELRFLTLESDYNWSYAIAKLPD